MNVYINLAVSDLAASRAFYSALDFAFDSRFEDETGMCMTLSDKAAVMLLSREKFASFTDRAIVDAQSTAQTLLAILLDSRADVDAMADCALAAGGTEAAPAQDHGFMYGRAFADPDGHVWEPIWMDPAAVPAS